jgi:hypothetical protein
MEGSVMLMSSLSLNLSDVNDSASPVSKKRDPSLDEIVTREALILQYTGARIPLRSLCA